MSNRQELEPLKPREAKKMYIDHRRGDVSEKTLTNHKYRLDSFTQWCDENELTNLNVLTGRDLHRYRIWLKEGEGKDREPVNNVTLTGILSTFRVFLEFCATIDAVEPGLRERVTLPETTPEEEARNVMLEEDRANEILDYLNRFEYASRDHVILSILWHTGMRLGTLRALDVEDFDPDAKCFDIHHREETGTRLKNAESAQRSIAVGDHYCQVISDYLEYNRIKVEDEYGRRPLISSEYGRLSATSIRHAVYRSTRPCEMGPCPHERDPASCEAMTRETASMCPSSRSPHGIRRGSITKHRRDGTPRDVISERANVSPDILDQHYDETTERERMEIRRQYLGDV